MLAPHARLGVGKALSPLAFGADHVGNALVFLLLADWRVEVLPDELPIQDFLHSLQISILFFFVLFLLTLLELFDCLLRKLRLQLLQIALVLFLDVAFVNYLGFFPLLFQLLQQLIASGVDVPPVLLNLFG